MLAQFVNLAAEINSHVVTARLGIPPEDYASSFDLVARTGALDAETAIALRPLVGLRDIVTHEYLDVDLDMVGKSVPLAIRDYGSYVRQLAESILEDEACADRRLAPGCAGLTQPTRMKQHICAFPIRFSSADDLPVAVIVAGRRGRASSSGAQPT